MKGTIAITSNETIAGNILTSNVSLVDKKALDTRYKEICIFKIREEFVLSQLFLEQMREQSVAFSILTNIFYLSRQNGYKDNYSIPRSFTEVQHKVYYDAPIFEQAGFEHMSQIFKDKNIPKADQNYW